jgi:hypothetical protein
LNRRGEIRMDRYDKEDLEKCGRINRKSMV